MLSVLSWLSQAQVMQDPPLEPRGPCDLVFFTQKLKKSTLETHFEKATADTGQAWVVDGISASQHWTEGKGLAFT